MTFVFLSFAFVSNFGFRVSKLFALGVLCPVDYSHVRGVSVAFVAVFHGESHLLSDSLNPNSTEYFKYYWLDISDLSAVPCTANAGQLTALGSRLTANCYTSKLIYVT